MALVTDRKQRMSSQRWLLVTTLLFVQAFLAFPTWSEASPVLTPKQQVVARELKSQVMAPCCWHGTVDNHNSPAADQVAAFIDASVAEGKSKDAILEALVKQHGERILARPRTSGFGLVFYVGPVLIALVSLALLLRWLRRGSRLSPSASSKGTAAAPDLDVLSARFEREVRGLE